MQNETVTITFHDTIQPVKDQVGKVAHDQDLTLTQDPLNPLVQTAQVDDATAAKKFIEGLKHVKGVSIKATPFVAGVTEIHQPVDPPAAPKEEKKGFFGGSTKSKM